MAFTPLPMHLRPAPAPMTRIIEVDAQVTAGIVTIQLATPYGVGVLTVLPGSAGTGPSVWEMDVDVQEGPPTAPPRPAFGQSRPDEPTHALRFPSIDTIAWLSFRPPGEPTRSMNIHVERNTYQIARIDAYPGGTMHIVLVGIRRFTDGVVGRGWESIGSECFEIGPSARDVVPSALTWTPTDLSAGRLTWVPDWTCADMIEPMPTASATDARPMRFVRRCDIADVYSLLDGAVIAELGHRRLDRPPTTDGAACGFDPTSAQRLIDELSDIASVYHR